MGKMSDLAYMNAITLQQEYELKKGKQLSFADAMDVVMGIKQLNDIFVMGIEQLNDIYSSKEK